MSSRNGQHGVRAGWAWAFLSLLVAGCGKDDAAAPAPVNPPVTFAVGGTVSGLVGSVTLTNNGGDARALTSNGSFTFATQLASGAAYSVGILSQPANQECAVTQGTGTVTGNVTGISIACETVRATATIGASGGTLLGPDGVQLEIPAGALTQDTLIGIARARTGAPPSPTENLSAQWIHEFTPHDQVFAAPVTIRMPVPAGAEEPTLLMASAGGDWMEVEAQFEDGFAVVERNSFSWGGVYVCAFTPGDPNLDPGGCVNPRGSLAVSGSPANGLTTEDAWATPRRHRMTAAGTVHFAFSYHVPASCTDGTVRLLRAGVQANGVLSAPLAKLTEQLAPMVVNNVAPPGRAADGSVTFNVPVTDADNGRWYYRAQLACTHRTGPRLYSLSAILEVDVGATPPPQPTVNYSIGGAVSGLTGTGLVLQNNATDDLAITADGAFTFATELPAGSAYSVSVRTQPANPSQVCSLQNAAGTASNHVVDVAVTCAAVTARTWRTPQVIDANGVGEAEAPRVGFDGAGNAVAVWTFVTRDQITGNPTSEIWSNRYSRAGGWGVAQRITQIVDGGVEDLRLGVLPSGEAVAAWVQAVGPNDDLYSSRLASGSWSVPAPIEQQSAEVKSLRMTFTSSGAGFAVWLQETGPFGTEDVWASRYVSGTGWSAPALLEQRDDGAGDPAIAASADGTAIAVWGQSDGDAAMRMNRYVPGAGWSGDATISTAVDYPSDELVIAMDDAGRAAVAYTRNGFSGGVFGLRYANGVWSAVEPLRPSPLFYPARLTIAMRGSGEALVMWVEGEGLSDMWAKPFGVLTGNAVPAGDRLFGGLRPAVVFDADGTALAAWNYGGQVVASRYTHGAATPWSTPVQVSPDVSASDVQLAVDPVGNAIAVWQQNVSSSHSDIAANVLR